jgi:DNA primase
MKTYPNIKSAATIDAMIHYAETLLGIRFTSVKKNRYNAPMPIPRRHQRPFHGVCQ